MRFALATALLLGLAACSQGPSETAPPPAMPAAAPAPGGPPPAMGAGAFDGHYAGSGSSSAPGPVCARDQNYDFTVAGNQISGTAAVTVRRGGGRSAAGVSTSTSDVTGTVDPSGKAMLELHPHGPGGARGTATGQFTNGRFTGQGGAPCARQITASRQ